MTSKEYQKKLLDPRWQKKRLKIFERDGWKCTIMGCTHTNLPLHVHHIKYMPGDPWDIPDKYLKTMCEFHHTKAHEKSVNKWMYNGLRKKRR